jgi:hypothetical protein
MSDDNRTIVSVELPRDLVDWINLRVAEQRLDLLKAGKDDRLLPTRSSFLRNLILKAKNNGNTPKS